MTKPVEPPSWTITPPQVGQGGFRLGLDPDGAAVAYLTLKSRAAAPAATVEALARAIHDALPPPSPPTPAEVELAKLERLAAELQGQLKASAGGLEATPGLRAIASKQEQVVEQAKAVAVAAENARLFAESEKLSADYAALITRTAQRLADVRTQLANLQPTADGFAHRAAKLEERAAALETQRTEAQAGLRQLQPKLDAARRLKSEMDAKVQAARRTAINQQLQERRAALLAKLAQAASPVLHELAALEKVAPLLLTPTAPAAAPQRRVPALMAVAGGDRDSDFVED